MTVATGKSVRRGIALTPMETRRDVIVRMAILADELGYELFSVPEGWGFDSTLILAEIAIKTQRIRPMSGILSIWGRTPGTIAMNAATLHEMSDDRYVLGLGASTQALVEGYHGIGFKRPTRRLRNTVTEVRRLLSGERADIDDDLDSRPLRMGQKPRPDIPIVVAAMGRQSIRVAAEEADGWFPFYITRDRIARRRAEIDRLRDRAGLETSDYLTLSGPTAFVSPDAESARARVAANVAWYVTAMGDVYANSLRRDGFESEVEATIAANPKPSPQSAVIPDSAERLLQQLTVYGPPDRIRTDLEAWDSEVDVTMLSIIPNSPWEDIEAVIRAGAPPA